MADDHSIDGEKGEESTDDSESAEPISQSPEPESTDEGEVSIDGPSSALFTQSELDEQIRVQDEIDKTTTRNRIVDFDSDESEPIIIEKEEIQDPELLGQLMKESSGSDGTDDSGSPYVSNLLTQDDIDGLLAAQLAKPKTPKTIDVEKMNEYLKYPRPPILKEEIEDSKLFEDLMDEGSLDEKAESDDGASTQLASQADVDAVIQHELEMAKTADAIMKSEAEEIIPAEEEEPDDFGLLSQDEIDSLLSSQENSGDKKKSKNVFTKPIDTEAWPEGYSHIEEDEGFLDQAEIDKLLNGGADAEPEIESVEDDEVSLDQSDIDALLAGQGDEPAEEPVADASDEVSLDQSDIDALLAGQGDEPAEDPATELSEEAALDQSDIDALLAAQGEKNEEEPDVASTDETSLDQSDIDALLAVHGSDTAEDSAAETSDESNLDQSDIDALLAEHGSDSVDEPAADASDEGSLDQSDIDALLAGHGSESADEPTADASDEGSLDQSDIDSLLAGHGSESADEPTADASDEGSLDQSDIDALLSAHGGETAEEPVADAADEGSLDQSDIDAMLSAHAGDLDEELKTDAEEEGTLDQSDIDALLADHGDDAEEGDDDQAATEVAADAELAKIAKGDPESLLNDGSSNESLSPEDMEDRLDGGADEEVVISVDTEAPETSVETPSVEPETQEPEETIADAEPEAVGTVAAENAAAGAPESQRVKQSDVPAESSGGDDEEVHMGGDEMIDERRMGSGKIIPFPNFSSMVDGQGTRLMAGIAAGLIVTISSFSYLMVNRVQSLGAAQYSKESESDTLQRAVALARELMEDGNYEGAYKRLTEGIESSPKSLYRMDAEYLLLETKYQLYPDRIDVATADKMHSQIDQVIAKGPMHPDKTKALYIKGKMYEKQGNLLAAKLEFRNILHDDPNSDRIDQILFALGELELKTDHPLDAANYFQTLRRNHPASALAGDAHLMLGDAYADLGDKEQARKMYIEVAEEHLNDKTGAAAFARLGKLDFESGDYDNAIRELENRIKTSTTVEGIDSATLLLAKAYRAKKLHEKARDTLNGFIDYFPESSFTPTAYMELAKVHKDLDMEREGVRIARQTIQRYPDNPEVLEEAGQILADYGDLSDAARIWVDAHEAGANNPEILLSAGQLLSEEEQYDDAIEALNILVKDFPRSSESIMGNIEIAKANFALGNLTEAADQLDSLALITTNQAQKMAVLQSTSELYSELGLWERVAAAQGAITAMTNESEQLAKSAVALYKADHLDEGFALEERIDLSKLTPDTQYLYMVAHGTALTRIEPRRGLEWLQNAHDNQPEARTPGGVRTLLDVNLSLGNSAQARALVSELTQDALAAKDPMKMVQAQQAATRWGDFLFERGDYRAAVDAYGMALNKDEETVNGRTQFSRPVTDDQNWSMYQRANSLFRLDNFSDSLALYEQVAGTDSPWAKESGIKATTARLKQKMRGDVDTPLRETG